MDNHTILEYIHTEHSDKPVYIQMGLANNMWLKNKLTGNYLPPYSKADITYAQFHHKITKRERSIVYVSTFIGHALSIADDIRRGAPVSPAAEETMNTVKELLLELKMEHIEI